MADDVVIDRGQSKLSDLWTKEDYLAIWLGFFLLFIAYLTFGQVSPALTEKMPQYAAVMTEQENFPIKTVEYYQAEDAKAKLRGSDSPAAKFIAPYLKTPARWKTNPIESLYLSAADAEAISAKARPIADEAKASAEAALATAIEAQKAAAALEYKDLPLNEQATAQIEAWRDAKLKADAAEAKANVKPYNLLPGMLVLGVVLALLFGVGAAAMGINPKKFLVGFIGVYLLCIVANILGNQSDLRHYGFNAEIFSIAVGMLIANTIGTPRWVMPAVQVEFYIKTGLVVLGAEVLFDKILAIGTPGIFVAWVVTPIVLVSTYIFGQKVLKIPSKTLNIVISSDMSVCGTSAAIATAAACRAKKEELTLSIGLSLTFTALMMIFQPMFIKAFFPETINGMSSAILGGAWIGGTIDSTGAVAAAGAVLGDKGIYVAATVKMIQNILIGVTAFFVAVYWTARVDNIPGQRVSAMEIWHRFPKFVLGFVGASIIFSVLSGSLGPDMSNALITDGVNKMTVPLRGWCFALAFISIGLATNFRELTHYFKGGKPVILYACGQTLNLCLTLLMAYIMFYLVFPDITANI